MKLFPKEAVFQGDLTRRSSLCLCLLVTVFFVWFCGAMEAAAADAPAGEAPVLNKRALILVSAAFGATATDRYVTGLLNGLKNGGIKSGSISIEYLNLARNMNKEHRQALATLLAVRYSDVHFDVVFCVQQPALDFLLHDVPALAPQAMVFGWTAQLPTGVKSGDRQFVFQSTRLDYRGTLERALELFPGTERVIVMQGNSEVELSRWENIREDLAPWKDKLIIENTQALSADDIEARLTTAPKNTIVMGIGITRDVKGQIFVPPEFIARVVKTSKVPYFAVVDLGVEYGAIGGMVTRLGDDAAALSSMAVDVLRGTAKLKEQVTLVPNIKTPVFSWPQLKHWGGDPDVLPANTVFVNRPPTLWSQYRNYVIASVLVLSLLVLIIVIMIWQNRRLSITANALRKSEERNRAITQSAPDAVVTSDSEGNIVGCNPRAEAIFGRMESEVLGQPLTLLIPERYRDRHLAGMNRIRSGGEHYIIGKVVELSGLHKDGSEFPLELSLAKWETADGWFVTGIIRDMTERAREERLLRLEHAISRRLAEAGDVSSVLREVMRTICERNEWGVAMYWRVDETAGVLRLGQSWNEPEGKLERYTEATRDTTFAPGKGLVGKVWQSGEPIWVADFSSDPRVVQKALAQELHMQGALMFPVMSEGSTLGVFAFLGLALREPDERLIAATRVIGNEVGQFLRRKRAEAELHESEARFRAMAEMASDFYWETDGEHRFMQRTSGSKGSALVAMKDGPPVGLRPWEIPSLSPDEAGWQAHRALLDAHLPFRNFEISRIGVDGATLHTSNNGDPLFDSLGVFKSYRGVGTDITERKRASEELRRSEARFRSYFNQPMIGIAITSPEKGWLEVNPRLCEMLGYSREEITHLTWAEITHPDDIADDIAQFDRVLQREIDGYSLDKRFMRKDGSTIHVAMSASCVRADDGRVEYFVALIQDITERVLLERRTRETQKMEALGTLAGGVAHDFNNALAAILGNVELARQDVGVAHPALESLEEIDKAGRRAKNLVQQILAFGRRQVADRKAMQLCPVVQESVRLLRTTLPAAVQLEVNCAQDVPEVLADATQIEQVLLNLCTNAWHALQGVERTGLIVVQLEAVERDGERFASLTVSDNGLGMAETTRARIFEPFFTTKAVGEGTGLGLSVVHGIVKAHGASIEVRSELGKGTSFIIHFPAAPASSADTTGLNSPSVGAGGDDVLVLHGAGKSVLYVDDDESIVFLMTRLLERQGYRVRGFTDAHTALAEVRSSPCDFDLVVTDYNMPGMSGLDLALALKDIRADLPVALASGYVTDELRDKARAAGIRELIYKPDTAEELSGAVARLAHTVVETPNSS